MKLKDFLEIVYVHARLSIFSNDDSDYLIHNLKKDEIIREHHELLDREIYYIDVHWYESDEATLGVVLL